MNGLSIGPFVLSSDRLALVLAIGVVMAAAGLLSRRVDPRFNLWSYVVLAVGLAAARGGHVFEHAESFASEPWRVLAVWQGGFAWGWAAAPVALATVLVLRRPRLIAWAAAAVVVAVLTGTMAYQLTARSPQTPLPDITLAALDGPPVNLAKTAGRPTVINLWATWCPPCRREMPLLAQVANAHPDVRFVFANQGEPAEKIKQYLERQGLVLPGVVLDTAQDVPRHYGTLGIPVTLFVAADGRLSASHLGEISREQLDSKLAAIDDALARRTGPARALRLQVPNVEPTGVHSGMP